MLDFPRWKRFWLWSITLVAVAASLPSLFAIGGLTWPSYLPSPQVNLGLDLAGGSDILLEADPQQVANQRLQNMEEAVRNAAQQAEPTISIGDVSTRDGRLSFIVENASDVDRMRQLLLPMMNGPGMVREWDLSVVDETRIILTPTQSGLTEAVNQAMDSAKDVIVRRIDALGTLDPTILREGGNRIVVQAPGQQDPEALKALIGETAELEFKLVDINALQSDIEQGIAPPGSEIVPYAEGTPFEGTSIAVRRLGGIRGDSLTNAQQSFDGQTNEAVVSISFNAEGTRRFARLTSENVNRPFAIILDGKVLSAPNINEPILGGQAQISGSFTVESAYQLAISLQSGALPVDLTVVQEGIVGPELGADSIRKGVIALVAGSAAVLFLMAVTYGRFGLYANAALLVNVLMLFGIMGVMNTTLTLPGIAGFVLTIGSAVDANVLINERIREERKRGRSVVAAIENGYREASRAIYDANITNFIAGVLLFLFGSGPVRGFAVVLVVGLVTSVFTAVTLTRMWVAVWLRRTRPQDINI